MTQITSHLSSILSVIEQVNGNSDQFTETLRRQHLPHLSFSQVSTVEFCPYRYYLQYEELIEPDPLPDYFTKGKLLHQVIAATYANLANHLPVNPHATLQALSPSSRADHALHLRNAVSLHLENLWQDCTIVAVERPFAIQVDDGLPPIVGVIDLILKQDGNYVLIDHKTGRDFYPQDELQMAIYVEYMRRCFDGDQFLFYYEHYRWVNNLKRIRKPAFQRTEVILPPDYWRLALERIRQGYQIIDRIKSSQRASQSGDCFRCPYRKHCWG